MNILPLKLSNSEHNKKQVWNILPNLFHDPSAFNLLTSKLRLRLYVDQNHLDIDGTTFPRDKECVWSWSPTRTWHRRVSRPTTRLLSMKQKMLLLSKKRTNLLNVFQAVANDVNQNAMQKSSSSKKGSKRSQMEQETNQVLPSSTGQNFWVIGG